MQHAESKADMPACPQCFRAIGAGPPALSRARGPARPPDARRWQRRAGQGGRGRQQQDPLHDPPRTVVRTSICIPPKHLPPPALPPRSPSGAHAARPEQVIADLLCAAIERCSAAAGEGAPSGGGLRGGCSEDGDEVDPAEAARRLELVRAWRGGEQGGERAAPLGGG